MHPDTPDNNILVEAQQITSVDRQRYYGHPLDNHGCTADLWDTYLERRREACRLNGEAFVLDERDVCWLNVLQKASRDANLRKRDNLVDGAGYLRNAEMIDQEAERREAERIYETNTIDLIDRENGDKVIDTVKLDHGLRGRDGKFHTLAELDEHDYGRPDGYDDGF